MLISKLLEFNGDCSRTRKRVALSAKTISSQHRSIPFALAETHHMVSALALPPEDSPQKFHGQRGTVADNNTVDRKENCLAPLLTTQRSQCRFRGRSLLSLSLSPPPPPQSTLHPGLPPDGCICFGWLGS